MGSPLFNILMMAVQVPASLFIIGINAMVIKVALGVYDLQPSIRYFVCSLALSDLLKGVYTIYDSAYADWLFNLNFIQSVLCTIGYALFSTLMIADILTVTCLSIDRLLILEYPFRYKLIVTRKNVQISCAISWFVAILSGGVPYFFKSEMKFPSCNYFGVTPFHSLVIISAIWCPILVTILGVYVRIYILLRRHIRQVVPMYLHNTPNARLPTWRQLTSTFMAFVTLIVVLIGVAPTFFLVLYMTVCSGQLNKCPGFSKDSIDIATPFTATIMVFTGIANPLIYGLRVREIGDSFRQLACCIRKFRKRPIYVVPLPMRPLGTTNPADAAQQL